MKNLVITAITLSIVLLGCPQQQTIQPVVTPPPVPGVEYCAVADLHLEAMCRKDSVANAYCCKVDAPTKKGESYTSFCEKKQAQGVNLNPQCLSLITSCNQIDLCTNSK